MACKAAHHSSQSFSQSIYRFRWVVCQLDVLRRCLAPNLRRRLNELPQSLDETYERVLREIHSTNQGDARRLLHCLAVAKQPLRVEELAEVLAYDLDAADGQIPRFHAEWRWEDQEQAVLSACSSLISIVDREGSRVVQFSHFSVKEFLTSKRLAAADGDVSQYHILPEQAHTTFTRACLGVLLRLDDHVDKERAKNIPLAEYAAEYWVSHAQVESVTSHVGHAMEILFDSKEPHFSAWLRIYCVDSRVRSIRGTTSDDKCLNQVPRCNFARQLPSTRYTAIPPMYATPLYCAALYGFHNLVKRLAIKNPEHVNAIDDGHCPLFAALLGKHLRAAETLLELGANTGPTPLHQVIHLSDDDAVSDAIQVLLKHGADVNARLDDLSTPLHLAASKGRFSAAQLLLEYKADVNYRNELGEAPLHLASADDNRRVLGVRLAQLLLEHGADANAKAKNRATPLHYAAKHRRQDVARILLAHGAQVNARDNKLRTPLHLLLSKSYKVEIDFARLLLEKCAELNAQDENYETPLHLASKVGKRDVAQILIDRGAEVNAANNWGETPLHKAIQGSKYGGDNYLDVVQFLLKRGADAYAQDNNGTTPLHLASEYRSLEFVRTLLNHGAKVNAENSRGETSLHRLLKGQKFVDSECPRVALAQLLLERGANVNTRDKDQITPLHLASDNRSFDVTQLLVDFGADINAKNAQGQTPFSQLMKSSSGHEHSHLDLILFLLKRGADINTRSKDNTTALHSASKYGLPEVTRVLLNRGASVNAKNNLGRTPLHELAVEEHRMESDPLAVSQLLLENNADVNALDNDHETPLHLASKHRRLSIIRVLIDHGAIVDSKNNLAQTPLHVSCKEIEDCQWTVARPKDIVQLLLERGANANARDKDNATPLHLASSSYGLLIASVLLDGGANVNANDNCGRTPLHRLLANGHNNECDSLVGFVSLLLKRGAEVNAEDEDQATALHLAFNHRDLKIAPVLLDHGANPNAENNLGETPLHRLLKYNYFGEDLHLNTVQLLLESGANPNVRDKDGVTPLQLTSRNGMPEVARLLRNYGAKKVTEDDQDQVPLHTTNVSSKKIPVPRSSLSFSIFSIHLSALVYRVL
jgi:serine/threonine-protein phosphatase 6 regulatory ankyrin repeat subunit B